MLLIASQALADNYDEARKAALTSIFIQTGLKDNSDRALALAKNKAASMGLAPILTIGVWAYNVGIKKQIKIKTGGFTFEGTNNEIKASYAFSF